MSENFTFKAPDCKHFSGYKPCFPDHDCATNGCKDPKPHGTMILIINFDAMGDVLMTTAQLPALKREFPTSTIHWVTLKIAAPLLENNPLIDKVHVFDAESILVLEQFHFHIAMNVDKSQRSAALLHKIKADKKLGFGLDGKGKIIPLNKGAWYNYQLGMDDHLKFKVNTRTGEDYLAETFEIPYSKDDYVFEFTEKEKAFISEYKKSVGINEGDFVIGFNTGCSNLFPNKKMTVEQHIELITRLLSNPEYKIVLLGGPEDTDRNAQIAAPFGNRIISTPTSDGVRKGCCYEDIADVVITGDSFGMHLAIALKKFVIVWFGLSCQSEIELFDRGVKLFPKDLECSPCWKKQCPYNLECIAAIDLNAMEKAVEEYYAKLHPNRNS